MRSTPFVALTFAAVVAVAGCASAPSPSTPLVTRLDPASRPAGDAPVAVRELHRTSRVSTHEVVVVGEIRAHRHERHDETVTILEGRGTFVLDGEEHLVLPGTVLHVPAGAVHSYRHESPGATRAVSVFSPPFDGEDRVLVDESGTGAAATDE